MKLNAAGNWTVIVSVMALVALTGTTVTAAGSNLQSLAIAGVIGIVTVIVIASGIVAATLMYDRRARQETATVTTLPLAARDAAREAA